MSGSAATPPQLFDRALYLRRLAAASGALVDEFDARLLQDLLDRLAVINHSFASALLLASRPAAILQALLATGKFAVLTSMPPPSGDDLGLTPESSSCIISFLDLHAVNDVPGYLAQIAAALKPDGLAIFAFFAGDTLRELREAFLVAEQDLTGGVTPRVSPMIDLHEAGGLLQRAGLALPVADLDRLPLRYGEVMTLMRDINQLGLSNCLHDRTRNLTSPALLLRAAAVYAERFADADGRLPVTVEVAWAMAWKPHPSQQQPQKPGSARARLADALKVRE